MPELLTILTNLSWPVAICLAWLAGEFGHRLTGLPKITFYGIVARVEPKAIGRGIVALGGGRGKMDDVVDPTVGFVISARPGDWVEAGEPLATIFAQDQNGVEVGRQALRAAILVADEAEPPVPLVSHRVSSAGVEVYEDLG